MNGSKGALGFVIAAGLLAVIAAAACQGYVFIEEPKHQTGTQRNFIPIETISKADILFMVDNSGSMAQEQANLASNFAVFINKVLEGQNDFHIGIVTCDVNFSPLLECSGACVNGMDCLQATGSSGAVKVGSKYCTKECGTDDDCYSGGNKGYHCNSLGDCTPSVCGKILGFDNSKKYCYPENNGRLRAAPCPDGVTCEHTGKHEKVMTNKVRVDVGDDEFQKMFRDNVKVGTDGSGFEKGLQALRQALDREYVDPVTGLNLVDHENLGFLRPEARLTLIAVSDEEDCSHDPFDPNFNEKTDTNDVCYPSPNTCHPDCQPREATAGCNPGEAATQATEDSEYVKKGVQYCMIGCAGDSDCANASVSGLKCGTVKGFGAPKYCNCAFNAPVSNSNSKYAFLTPTQDFIDFFKGLKKDPNDVNMAVIVGAKQSGSDRGQPDNCSSPNGVACAGKRYYEVAAGMTKYLADSICQADFQQTLVDIAGRLIVSNERVLSDVPLDPTCIQVKVGGTDVPRCKNLSLPCNTDGGTATTDCPESTVFCGDKSASCKEDEGTGAVCDCSSLSDPAKKCKCLANGKAQDCLRPIYWQYKPPCASADGQPRVVFNGCGLEAGDKLEINFMSSSTTTGDDAGFKCE